MVVAATLAVGAHDFWLVPDAMAVGKTADIVIRGQTSSAFPTSESAVAVDRITDARVFEAIREGRRVNLEVRDAPDKRHRAAASGLSIFEFYRQSMLLVGWLKAQDETRFRTLALAVQDNTDFEIAFWNIYGQAPATRLAGFFEGVLGDNQPIQAAPAQP